MAADWLGSIVSINCGNTLGVYQGRVSAVDQLNQTISLTYPFHNGVKCLVPEVTFRAGDIAELKILDIPTDGSKHSNHQMPDHTVSGSYLQFSQHNGTGKQKSSSISSAAQNIPRRVEVRGPELGGTSPQPCSKSYVERHLETLNQPKNFRRRHNSCEYPSSCWMG